MTRLACSAHNCVNYVNGMCSALTIEVDGESAEKKQETCCNTFAPRTFVNAIKSAFNTNYAGTIMQALDGQEDVDHKIKCYAMNCTYNVGMTCTSTDIQVFGPEATTSTSTEYETFYKK